jgi:hypothetical protein
MKKIFLLLSIVSIFGLTACSNDDDRVDHDTFPETFETKPVNFTAAGEYSVTVPLIPKILASDVVLVYRLSGVNNLGNDVWQPLPAFYDVPQGSLNYSFDFSQDDVVIYLNASFDPMLRQDLAFNQIFKIALVPGFVAKNLKSNDYDVVMSALENAKIKGNVQIETIK